MRENQVEANGLSPLYGLVPTIYRIFKASSAKFDSYQLAYKGTRTSQPAPTSPVCPTWTPRVPRPQGRARPALSVNPSSFSRTQGRARPSRSRRRRCGPSTAKTTRSSCCRQHTHTHSLTHSDTHTHAHTYTHTPPSNTHTRSQH